jgi:ADP-heptose:LPS heptosyltransferase
MLYSRVTKVNEMGETERADRFRRKVCVLFPGALGDFICFLPALHALAGDAAVDLFARTEFADIAPTGVSVDSLERAEISTLFRSDSVDDAPAQRFFRSYDAVYSWFASRDENAVRRLKALTQGRARLFPFRPSSGGHQTDHYLSSLGLKGFVPPGRLIEVRPQAVAWAAGSRARHLFQHRPLLAIAPGSGAREKNWPVEDFFATARWWKKSTGGQVVRLIGPVERERGGSGAVENICVNASDLSLSQVCALLARSDVYLGNDSGISHLAAALGVPTVALFGPTDARQWAPRGEKVILLRRGIACSPCGEAAMKGCPHRACLNELQPADVIALLAGLPEVLTLTR